jgi:hypothetical protein
VVLKFRDKLDLTQIIQNYMACKVCLVLILVPQRMTEFAMKYWILIYLFGAMLV